jgi:hypothetical protein
MVDEFGHGLKVVISCKGILEHDWMSFVCWYAFMKNLPDARYLFICERNDTIFTWPYKFKVKMAYYKNEPLVQSDGLVLLKIPPNVMPIRPYMHDNIGPVDVKSNILATFVDYGNLIFENHNGFPSKFIKYRNPDMTPNEVQVIKLLESCEILYRMF